MNEYIMEGAELASMKKGQLRDVSNSDICREPDADDLHLTEEQIRWWRNAKFGLFIHWGVYSLIGKGEWAYYNEQYTEETYRQIAESDFCPNRDGREIAEEWINTAQTAGMRYAVMVTRHHDGFAMWDSPGSWKDFTSVKCGPKEDYVKAFTDVCHEKGIHTGLYYSPMDWRFPGYFDPRNKIESAIMMKEQAYLQIEELCTRYGKVEILWYDGGWLAHEGSDADAAWLWEPIKLNRMVRTYQPGIMVTPRSGYRGDFSCDEGPGEVKGKIISYPWEKCLSISEAWGFRLDDNFHSFPFLLKLLINTVCRDGNLLLNVGPDPEGRIPNKAKEILTQMGEWLSENGEAIYETRGGFWQPVDEIYGSTYTNSAVYIHILNCKLFQGTVLSKNVIPQEIKFGRTTLLDGAEIEVEESQTGIRLILPDSLIEEKRLDTIIKIEIIKMM